MSRLIIIKDSTHDESPGVYERYNGKPDWMAKTIERMEDQGYKLQQRIPDLGLTIFEPKDTSEDKRNAS